MASADYISREAFLAEKRHLYCENCARRKGMKNGKVKFVYEIGDAPCRACGIGDMLDDVENFPAADVRPNVTGRWKEVEIAELNESNDWAFDLIASMYCPNCKRYHTEIYRFGDPTYLNNFCPNCGAKMEES